MHVSKRQPRKVITIGDIGVKVSFLTYYRPARRWVSSIPGRARQIEAIWLDEFPARETLLDLSWGKAKGRGCPHFVVYPDGWVVQLLNPVSTGTDYEGVPRRDIIIIAGVGPGEASEAQLATRSELIKLLRKVYPRGQAMVHAWPGPHSPDVADQPTEQPLPANETDGPICAPRPRVKSRPWSVQEAREGGERL